MTIWDFFYQAGFWQWFGLIVFFTVMGMIIHDTALHITKLLRK